jgi:hypothetical protein
MPTGIQILVPIGTNEGILTNVFIRIFSARVYPTGQATDLNVFAYPSLLLFQQGAQPLIIQALPPTFPLPALPISAFNNQASVSDFIYNTFLALILSVVGPGNAVIIP